MNHEEFEAIFDAEVEKCRAVLVEKAQEYADDVDRLHNFNVAAQFQGVTREQALWGMATKHFVSISDMVRTGDHSLSKWDEKLGDALNYLILLRALVEENAGELATVSDPIEPPVTLSPKARRYSDFVNEVVASAYPHPTGQALTTNES